MVSLEKLSPLCEIRKDKYERNAHYLTFRSRPAVVTIRVVFDDPQSGADMVITNMTTMPGHKRGKGHGTKALTALLAWARDEGLMHIEAVQVQRPAESFWTKNGFLKKHNVTNDFLLSKKEIATH